MPVLGDQRVQFNGGIVGPNMRGASNRDIYQVGCLQIENFICLPQGGLELRRGRELVADVSGAMTLAQMKQTMFMRFDFNRDQQYLLAFLPTGTINIYRNKLLVATVAHPYAGSALRTIKRSQSGDTMFLFHQDYPELELKRDGSDTNWILQNVTYTNKPYVKYCGTAQTITRSATTGNVTLTLSAGPAYWNAGHPQSVKIKIGTSGGLVTRTGLAQDATGGTALSSTLASGVIASAFDSNPANTCATSAGGWIGYNYSGASTTRVVGILANATGTVDLIFETAADNAFTSGLVQIGTVTVALTSGQWEYIDIPNHVAATRFRVRSPQALNVQDVVFNFGLRLLATVNNTVPGTAQAAWKEEAWSEAAGYPSCGSFFGDRKVVAGVRIQPDAIFASVVGSYYDFDDSTTDDDKAFSFSALSDKNHSVVNIKPSRNGLAVMSSDGEFIAESTDTLITPKKPPRCYLHSDFGSYDVPLVTVDGVILYVVRNGTEIKSFDYSFERNAYENYSMTQLAHNLFDQNNRPRRLTLMPNYRTSVAQLVFAPRSDGKMPVMTFDQKQQLKAWTIFRTQGKYLDAIMVETQHDPAIGVVPTMYFLINRTVNGVEKCFIESWSGDENCFLDHWYFGSVSPAQPVVVTLGTLPNTEVGVIVDGAVEGWYTTNGVGQFAITRDVSQVFAGLRYEGLVETTPIAPTRQNINLAGKPIMLKEAILDLVDALDIEVNGRRIYFRNWDADDYDAPLYNYTGQKRVSIRNHSRQVLDPTIILRTYQPVGVTIGAMNVRYKVGV